MAIDYPAILDLREEGQRFTYTDREAMLYALGIGFGADLDDAAELAFVYEKNLRVVPTLATTVTWGSGISAERMGIDYTMVVHAEEENHFHRPMPAAATLTTTCAVIAAYDKGPGKGAFIVSETVLRDARDGAPVATLRRTTGARGNGGFGGPSGGTTPHAVPSRAADQVVAFATTRNQAAIYRLSGDRNPLHIDPDRATQAGFKGPILHGLCSYGIACRAILQLYCEHDPTRLYSQAARFSAPVYPGEMLRFSFWRDADVVSFEAAVAERNAVVLKGGKAVIGPSR